MGTRSSVPAFKSRTTTSPAARSSGPTMMARDAPRAAASSSCLRMAAGRRPYSTATPRSRSWCASSSSGATSSPLTALKKASSSDGLAQPPTRLLAALYLAERGQYGVEPAQHRDFEHGIRFPFPDSCFRKDLRDPFSRNPLALVDRLERRAELPLAQAAPEQQGAQHAAIGHPDLHVARPQPEGAPDVDRGRAQLRVGQRARLPDDVHVELKVLPQPSPLLPLVAEQLRDREPADRLLERLGVRPHHAGEGGRHLGAQRDLAPALVVECVQLLHDLFTALVRIQLQRLERRAVVFLKSVAPRDLAPGGEDVVTESQFVG